MPKENNKISLYHLKYQLLIDSSVRQITLWFVIALIVESVWFKYICLVCMSLNTWEAIKIAHLIPEGYFKLPPMLKLVLQRKEKKQAEKEDEEIQRKTKGEK